MVVKVRKYLVCPIDDEHFVNYDCLKCWNRRCSEYVYAKMRKRLKL
jgi:hypothetical protein